VVQQPSDSIKPPSSNDALIKLLEARKNTLEIEKLQRQIDSLKAMSN